jgi:DNA-binding FrmR family transcriptional regulator
MNASSLQEPVIKELLSRLKKIEGQVRGIQGMINKDSNCTDILIQLSALSSAARKLGMIILQNCMEDCAASILNEGGETDVQVKVDDMTKAIYRFISMK